MSPVLGNRRHPPTTEDLERLTERVKSLEAAESLLRRGIRECSRDIARFTRPLEVKLCTCREDDNISALFAFAQDEGAATCGTEAGAAAGAGAGAGTDCVKKERKKERKFSLSKFNV